MKLFLTLVLSVSIFMLFTFCVGPNGSNQDSSFEQNEKSTLQFGDTLFAPEVNRWITFDSLYSDSRCPTNVECIWAGNAKLGFTFSYEGDEIAISLNTHPDFSNDTTLFDYKISLQDVFPYQHTDSTFIQNDYYAVIEISIE